ncbi:MAG: hypothetical protein F4240_04550, partial [Acidimicrobiia bacterium]|nr:hypothetical protein [Acidimicrobiia bacterium]
CWGNNDHGQTDSVVARFSSVSAGISHTCGLRTYQTIQCWGDNSNGQAAPPDGRFTAVSAGMWHSCAVRVDRALICWGSLAGFFRP